MERRDFLRAGAVAWAGLSLARPAVAETPGADPSKFPVVVSTWDFGEAANRTAYDLLHQGGSLLYDIPTDRPDAGSHRLPEPDGRHALNVEPGSQLAGVLGKSPGPVNSAHHQAVDEPGEGMRVSARAGDGLVEAIESTGSGFCVGVQWHPEKMHEAHRQRLFGAFTAACAAGR